MSWEALVVMMQAWVIPDIDHSEFFDVLTFDAPDYD